MSLGQKCGDTARGKSDDVRFFFTFAGFEIEHDWCRREINVCSFRIGRIRCEMTVPVKFRGRV